MIAWQDWQQWPAMWGQSLVRVVSQAGQNGSVLNVVHLLLILLLSYSLASLSWHLVPASEQLVVPVPKQGSVVAPRQQEAMDIARWHLFGEQELSKPGPQRVEAIPETRLKLILRGVISGDEGSASGAIIAGPSGKQMFYALGGDLPGGAVLKEVHERHIVLLRNGSLETLRLPRNSLGADVNDRQPSGPGVQSGARPLMSLSQYRDTLLENPQQLADVVQARPYRRNGIRGYQINPGRDAALFVELGLQPNDVITEVNGIKLDNPARGLNVLQTLKQQSQVTVEVVRDGVPQTLTVDVNQ